MPERILQFAQDAFRYALHLSGDRHAAEDLAQEALLRALAHEDQLKVRLDSPQALKAWLLTVVRNQWIDWQRRRKKSQVSLEQVAGPIEGREQDPARQLERQVLENEFMEAMQQLPERQRSVLYLVAVEGLDAEQTGEILEISIPAVRSSLSLARAKIRQQLFPPSERSLETGEEHVS